MILGVSSNKMLKIFLLRTIKLWAIINHKQKISLHHATPYCYYEKSMLKLLQKRCFSKSLLLAPSQATQQHNSAVHPIRVAPQWGEINLQGKVQKVHEIWVLVP